MTSFFKVKNLISLLDYIYYRVYFFYKKNKDSTPDWMAALVVSTIVGFSLLSLVSLLTVVFKITLSNIKSYGLLFYILILFFVWRKYVKNNLIEELSNRYSDEDTNQKTKRGGYIVAYLILVLSIPVLIGAMRHNLGWNI